MGFELRIVAKELKNGRIQIGEASARILTAIRSQAEAHGLNWTGARDRGSDAAAAPEREAEGGEGGGTLFQRGSSAKNLGKSVETGGETDQGPEGTQQTLIPGVQGASDRERILAAAKKPLRGGSAAPPEGGLFDETEKAQGERFQTAGQAPAFYAAVSRAVAAIKSLKGTAEQRLTTIRNVPGVKPEELKWLGLEDWLPEQKGTVTKEQIADYVRVNQIEVTETDPTRRVRTTARGDSPPSISAQHDQVALEPMRGVDSDKRRASSPPDCSTVIG
jgi:hypothetical protein